MIIKVDLLKNLCNTILQAVDTSDITLMSEFLQLTTKDGFLHFYVSNLEYFVDVKLDAPMVEEFNATVRAKTFLKLISQMTCEDVEFTMMDNCLYVKGNGNYKIPIVYDGNLMTEIPEITISNKTAEFDIPTDVLYGIMNYNGKELQKFKETALARQQNFYSLDQKGCITFTPSGACVNNFHLPQSIHILLNNKLVKLFKLFKSDSVHFELGFDAISTGTVKTKVKFYNDIISVTDILNHTGDDLKAFPVDNIRDMATSIFPYTASINRWELIQAINRILLFYSKEDDLQGTFMFGKDSFSVMSADGSNIETLPYVSPVEVLENDMYQAVVPLEHLRMTLESFNEPVITMNFGDNGLYNGYLVIVRGDVYNMISLIDEGSNE